jgi:hypothetical protein
VARVRARGSPVRGDLAGRPTREGDEAQPRTADGAAGRGPRRDRRAVGAPPGDPEPAAARRARVRVEARVGGGNEARASADVADRVDPEDGVEARAGRDARSEVDRRPEGDAVDVAGDGEGHPAGPSPALERLAGNRRLTA